LLGSAIGDANPKYKLSNYTGKIAIKGIGNHQLLPSYPNIFQTVSLPNQSR